MKEENEKEEFRVEDHRPEFKEEERMVVPYDSPNAIVLMAMNKKYGTEFIEKMMDLQDRHEKKEARKAFFKAKAAFKAEAPPVKKDRYNRQFKSYYTSLGNLLDTYNPILGKHGLDLSHLPPQQTDKTMTVECRLSHDMGHTESISMTGPIDLAAIGKVSGAPARNALQDLKSTLTYLRSATAESILGVAGSEASAGDDNGNSAGVQYIDEKQLSIITDLINAKDVDESAFLTYMGAESCETIFVKDYKKAVAALQRAKGKQVKKPSEREPGEDDE